MEISYQNSYYFSDGILVICFFIILFTLDIKVDKNKASFFEAISRICNPASFIFFMIILGTGIGLGVGANYVVVYLQEDMGASSAMVGKYFAVAFGNCYVIIIIC